MSIQPPSIALGYIVAAIIFCTMFGLRLLSRHHVRTLRLEMRWVWPGLIALAFAPFVYMVQPAGIEWLYVGATLIAGGLLGWRSSALTPITIDVETYEADQRPSFLALLLLALLTCFSRVAGEAASSVGLNGDLVTELWFAFGVCAVSAMQMEGLLRTLRILETPDSA
jgi:hypothetical protein